MAADPSTAPRSLGGRIVDLFSSITLGVCLLTTLFVYSSVGSSGVPMSWNILDPAVWKHVRTLPMFEMTEFEWFHWWPFDVLIALIGVNLVTATLRRIPFRPVNFGVWMIHTGLIVLGLGCVLYFSTKVEGDALVVRRDVRVTLPNGETGSMPAVPGNVMELMGDAGPVSFFVQEVNPQWPILSGEHEGERAYSVTVSVQEPGRMFQRQVLAGYPQYTEDIIRSGNPEQPFARAVKVTGERLIDDELEITLDYAPTTDFYVAHNLTKAWALYLREQGTTRWIERELDGMPLFNDHIASYDDVHLPPGEPRPPLRPLNVVASATDPDDPLADVDIGITQYLRYAEVESRWVPGRERNPVATVRLEDAEGREASHTLVAEDPARAVSEGGVVAFRWAEDDAAIAGLTAGGERSLRIRVPARGVDEVVPITTFSRGEDDAAWTDVEGTGYDYRVETVQDGMRIADQVVSVAILDVRHDDAEGDWDRWAFDHTYPNRDMDGATGVEIPLDDGIEFTYVPGRRDAPVTVVAGPDENDLRVVVALPESEPQVHDVSVGETVEVEREAGIRVTVESYLPRAQRARRPAIVPKAQRNRDAGLAYAMVRATPFFEAGASEGLWVPYHTYPIETRNDALRRFWLEPVTIETPDGRAVEMILSRQRMDLPQPVVLDTFEIKSHVGGFSGNVSSIADWISRVRFETESGYTEPLSVSMNKPADHEGLFYFQAQWDPPQPSRGTGDPPSAGLNYTVLGVGNGRGRYTMLIGVIISVIGMIYAFYVKPIIKRRVIAKARARAAAAASA